MVWRSSAIGDHYEASGRSGAHAGAHGLNTERVLAHVEDGSTLNTRSGFMTATAIARLLCSGLQLSVHADEWSKDIGVTFMSLWKIPVQVWCRFCRSTVYS